MSRRISRENLSQHELIGLNAKVIRSLNPSQLGTEGRVRDETMRTLVIAQDNLTRIIPKIGTVFRFTLDDGVEAEVSGDALLRRPEDRIKVRPRRAT